jgi:hypothetical protein
MLTVLEYLFLMVGEKTAAMQVSFWHYLPGTAVIMLFSVVFAVCRHHGDTQFYQNSNTEPDLESYELHRKK